MKFKVRRIANNSIIFICPVAVHVILQNNIYIVCIFKIFFCIIKNSFINFKSFYIDAAYQNLSSEYKSPFLRGSAANNTGYFSDTYIVDSNDAVVSNVKNTKDHFFITLGWRF